MYSRGISVCRTVEARNPANLLARTAMAPLNKEFSLNIAVPNVKSTA